MNYPKITIQNSTDVELEIYDVYNKTGDRTNPLTYTLLGKVDPGKSAAIQTVHSASQLQAMRSGTVTGLSDDYQVNFPIAVLAVTVFSEQTSYTVDKTNMQAMVQTFNFIRYVSANPASKIAGQFTAALGAEDQKGAVNTFFGNSASFNLCTLSTWSAVTSWQTQFLSPWQGSFYLYDASDNVQEIKLIAGVNITVSNAQTTAVLCMADANGKWSDASQQTTIEMNGGSITEANPGQGGVSVTLTPLWMNVQQNKDGKLTYLIGPTLSGTVNNTKVMGNFQQLSTTGGGTGGNNAKSMTPSLWNEIKQNVGMLISAGMLYIMYKQWQESKTSKSNEVVNKSKDPNAEKETIEKEQKQVEQQVDSDRNKDTTLENQKQTVAENNKELPAREEAVTNEEKILDAKDTLSQQKERLQEILEEAPPSDKIEQIADDLGKAETELDNGNPDEALSKLSDCSESLQQVVKENQGSFSQEQIKNAEKVEEDIKDATERSEEVDKAEKERQERDSQDSSDEMDSDDFDSVDSDPIEFGGGK